MLTRLVVSLMCLSGLSGCGTTYLWQAAQGQWQLMRKRQPIEQVVADAGTDATLKARLQLVQDARNFASEALQLPENGSYRSYAALDRPYVVWNVVAAPEFSLQPRRWCFPFAGCIAYRGYFREENARRYADTLRHEGFDVVVAGVAAYSTLGKFADPVLDTMMRYGDLELAGTIFHELAHQLLYVKNDSEFNEAFAMTVEQEGLARWLAARGRSAELVLYQQRRAQQQAVTRLFDQGRSELAQLYAATAAQPAAQRRELKQHTMAEISAAVRSYQQQQGIRGGYDAWLQSGLNNAHLASIGTYFDCVPGFQRLLAEQHGDLPAFYAAARKLGEGPEAARRALCGVDDQGSRSGAP